MSRRPYVRSEPKVAWFFRHPRYVRYLLRELTCLFIGAYGVLMVVGLTRLAEGRAAWEVFVAALASPAGIVFHLLTLAFAVYHSVTWFNLTPKALPLTVAGRRVPDAAIAGAHYLGWIVVSAALLVGAGAL